MRKARLNKLFHLDMSFKVRFYRLWNILKFRMLGVSLGKGSSIVNKVYLYVGNSAHVSIGDGFDVNSGDNINALCSNIRCSIKVGDNATLTIGNLSGMSGGCIWATDNITIGNHVNIGANCIIMDGDIHNTDWRLRHIDRTSESPIPYKHRPITIEDDVWIGANSIILKGVTIGARSIIGAGSVVTKDIPADCIAAGNPCRVINKTGGGSIHNTRSSSSGSQVNNFRDSDLTEGQV